LDRYPGDPTTPGYPSKPDSPRTGVELVTPQIPSLPLSWVEAQPLIQALDGYGPSGKEVNRTNWIGAFNASYSTGPAPGVTLSLSNEMQDNITTIWDSIGIINGTSQDEVIVIGNHRDAWIIGGAADPNSGSAIMVELSKAFGALLKTGWQPKRTIVLCSWDAEEYGLLGSTEFVEEYIPWLSTAAVSYLNIDVGTAGPNPSISATPDLHEIAVATMKKVVYDNYRGFNNMTLYDVWYGLGGAIGVLGSGSDYTAFLHNGISSMDMGAGGGPTDAIYHYHSNYDSYHWMATFGDVGFNTHKVMCRYLTLLAYELATRELLPLNPETYGVEMTKYLTTLEGVVKAAGENYTSLSLEPLRYAIQTFNTTAAAFAQVMASTSSSDTEAIDKINGKLRDYQRGFVSQGGLPNREFYKNVVFAPGLDTGYAAVTYGGITEAITFYENVTMAQEWVGRTSKAIELAAVILNP
jgi:N-acetylated-alpha-linked acidic dipeptidase